MNEKPHDECFQNTYSEGILYEFTSGGIPIDDEVRLRQRLGIPPRVIEERKREAAKFLEEMKGPSSPRKPDSDGILYEFTGGGIPIDDEVRARLRLGGPSPEVIEERKREAARFLEELKKSPAKPDASSDAGK